MGAHDHKGQGGILTTRDSKQGGGKTRVTLSARTPGVWIINHGVPKGKVFMGFIA